MQELSQDKRVRQDSVILARPHVSLVSGECYTIPGKSGGMVISRYLR